MMAWLTERERTVLIVLGALALAGLGALLWQRRTPPLTVAGIPAPRQAARWDVALRQARQVDVNTADAAELERLPEVGPQLARRIVAYRTQHGPFRSATELGRVPGIGPKTQRTLEPYVTVE